MRKTWFKNETLRGFVHVLGGQVFFTASQGLQFLVLARGLGPTEFGRLAAASSVAALLMPFSGMGAANVMLMRSTRDLSVLPVYFGNALVVMLTSASLLVPLAMFCAHTWLEGEVSVGLMAMIALSELVASKLIDICWHACVTREQFHYTSQFLGAQSVCRLVFATVFIGVTRGASAAGWAWWVLLSNALVSAWVVHRTVRLVGRPRADLARIRREFATGASFAVGISAKGFYTDADKLFLAHYAGAESVGQYTLAFRVVQIVLTPVRAISAVLQARLFRAGEAGIHGSLRVTLKVLGPLSLLAGALAIAFYASAPLLPLMAGDAYSGSITVLRTLSLLPLLLAVQTLLYDTLVTSAYQRLAAMSQVGAAILICGLSMALIPQLGWRGAAIASYGSQSALTIAMAVAIYRRRRASADASENAHA
jgi:O-antigen/teichoic acid export membrane protein